MNRWGDGLGREPPLPSNQKRVGSSFPHPSPVTGNLFTQKKGLTGIPEPTLTIFISGLEEIQADLKYLFSVL